MHGTSVKKNLPQYVLKTNCEIKDGLESAETCSSI